MNADYGQQIIAIFLVFIAFLVLVVYSKYYKSLPNLTTVILIVIGLIYYVGYFIYSIFNARLHGLDSGVEPQEEIDTAFYRITVISFILNVIFIIFGYFFSKCSINTNHNTFIIWFILFYMFVLFYFNRILVIEEGYNKLRSDFWGGIWFGFQSFATGSFLRYLVIIFAFIFAVYSLSDVMFPVLKKYYKTITCYSPFKNFKGKEFNLTFVMFSYFISLIFINRINFTWVNPITTVRDSSYIVFIFLFFSGLSFVVSSKNREQYLLAALIAVTFLLLFSLSDAPEDFNIIDEVEAARLWNIDPGYFGILIVVILVTTFTVLTTYKRFDSV